MMPFNRSHSKAGDNAERMLLNLEARLSQRMAAMGQRFDEQVAAMGQRFDEQVAAMEQRFDEQVAAMEQRFDEQVAAMEQRFDERMTAMEARLEGVFYRAFFALALFLLVLYGATVGLMIAFFS